MRETKEIVRKYKSAERDKTFPFAEWHRKDVFEKLIKDFLITLGYNPDQINYDDEKGYTEIEIQKGLKLVFRFLNNISIDESSSNSNLLHFPFPSEDSRHLINLIKILENS